MQLTKEDVKDALRKAFDLAVATEKQKSEIFELLSTVCNDDEEKLQKAWEKTCELLALTFAGDCIVPLYDEVDYDDIVEIVFNEKGAENDN